MTTTTPAPQQPAPLAKIEKNTVCTVPQLRTLFTQSHPELVKLYPAHMQQAAARLARAVVTEVQKNPELATCTGMSLVSCAVQAAQLNLEIGGPTGQSYMVPYWNKQIGQNEAQFQLGYRGMITLAYRSRLVAAVTAKAVRSGDEFDVVYGTRPGIDHRPGTGGDITHVYAVVQFKGGGLDFEVMTRDQIEQHRITYSRQGTDSNRGNKAKGIWEKSWEAMALKTVIRRLLKRCPIGVDLGAEEIEEPAALAADQPVQLPAAEPARQVESHAERSAGGPTSDDVFALCERLALATGGRPDKIAARICNRFDAPSLDDLSPDQLRQSAEILEQDLAEASADQREPVGAGA